MGRLRPRKAKRGRCPASPLGRSRFKGAGARCSSTGQRSCDGARRCCRFASRAGVPSAGRATRSGVARCPVVFLLPRGRAFEVRGRICRRRRCGRGALARSFKHGTGSGRLRRRHRPVHVPGRPRERAGAHDQARGLPKRGGCCDSRRRARRQPSPLARGLLRGGPCRAILRRRQGRARRDRQLAQTVGRNRARCVPHLEQPHRPLGRRPQ
mmetsp:Transcript_26905/g.101041  ORF Transcript_26905/g.101041 Transcript_26905/m.101041 type:complete len:211 (+) Transcript_26905:911-1543(+)